MDRARGDEDEAVRKMKGACMIIMMMDDDEGRDDTNGQATAKGQSIAKGRMQPRGQPPQHFGSLTL
jgi:hypothetical protein